MSVDLVGFVILVGETLGKLHYAIKTFELEVFPALSIQALPISLVDFSQKIEGFLLFFLSFDKLLSFLIILFDLGKNCVDFGKKICENIVRFSRFWMIFSSRPQNQESVVLVGQKSVICYT